MVRHVSSSRALLAGLIFFLLLVGGSLLYRWHVHRTTEAALAETQRNVQRLKNDRAAAHTAQNTVETSTVDLGHAEPNVETDDAQAMSHDTNVPSTDETSEGKPDMADAFLPDETTEEENTTGDFPEVPADFPTNLTPVWLDIPNYQRGDMHDHEMIYRVLIKLWNQGERGFVNGVFRDNNRRVYPLYPDVLYVQWDEEIVGGPDGPRTIRYPGAVLGTHDRAFTPEEMLSGRLEELYPNITFVEMDTAGYDPETFLTNEEK